MQSIRWSGLRKDNTIIGVPRWLTDLMRKSLNKAYSALSSILLTGAHPLGFVTQGVENLLKFVRVNFAVALAVEGLEGPSQIIRLVLSRESLLESSKPCNAAMT